MPYAGIYSTTEIMTISFAQPQLFKVSISDTTQLQDTMKKAIGKALSDPIVLTDNGRISFQNLHLVVIDALSQGDSQQKFIAKVMQDNTSLQDTISKQIARSIQDSTTLQEILTRFAVKGQTASDVTTLNDFVRLIFARKVADDTVLAEALTRSVVFTGVIMQNEPQVDLIDTNDLSIDIESTIV